MGGFFENPVESTVNRWDKADRDLAGANPFAKPLPNSANWSDEQRTAYNDELMAKEDEEARRRNDPNASWQYPFKAPERQAVNFNDFNQESQWGQLQRESANQQYGADQSQLGADAMRSAQTGMNTMASQGGLTGGGRVALMNNATQQRAKGLQTLSGQHATNLRGIQQNDIANQLAQANMNSDKQFEADKWNFGERRSAYDNEQQARVMEDEAMYSGIGGDARRRADRERSDAADVRYFEQNPR